MRIQLTLSEATGNELKRRANEFGMNVSVLAEHVLREWIRRERSITLTASLPVQPQKEPAVPPAPLLPVGGASEVVLDEGDEDTMQCKDCAQVLPMSEFVGADLVHYNCRDPGADLVALRRETAGIPPLKR